MSPIATAPTRLSCFSGSPGGAAALRQGDGFRRAALVIGQWLEVPLVLWAVLTAVIVTQTSVGRSLKATIDYFIGTLGGAVYAGAVAALIPHASELALLAVLALAVAPLVPFSPRSARSFCNAAAPFTAIIVVLAPIIVFAATPIESGLFTASSRWRSAPSWASWSR